MATRTDHNALYLPSQYPKVGEGLIYRKNPDGEWEFWVNGWMLDESVSPGPQGSCPGPEVSYEDTWAEPLDNFALRNFGEDA